MRRQPQARFQYHAHCVGVGGSFTTPRTEFLDAQPTIALPSTGGTVTRQLDEFNFRDIISFRSSSAQAVGIFSEESGSYNTLVSVAVEGLNVLDVLTADRVVARLASRHYLDPDREASITTLGSHFDGLKLNGKPIEFHLDHQLMAEWDTYSGAVKGCAERKLASVQDAERKRASIDEAERKFAFVHDAERKRLHTTLASELRAPAGCEVDKHRIWFPDLGTIHLGELYVTPYERRLTMLRFEFGCAVEGNAACGDVGGNGNPAPPI